MISTAADRNKEPILNALKEILKDKVGLKILEIASGTGQHIAHFAKNFPSFHFTPSDVDTRYFESIAGYVASDELKNVAEPLQIDITSAIEDWPEPAKSSKYDVIYCANMIHISPYETTIGLFNAAGKLLEPHGLLITYGPYAENGLLEPESNVTFDEGLRAQNPQWGVRDIQDLISVGQENRLKLVKRKAMPANNKILVFDREQQ